MPVSVLNHGIANLVLYVLCCLFPRTCWWIKICDSDVKAFFRFLMVFGGNLTCILFPMGAN